MNFLVEYLSPAQNASPKPKGPQIHRKFCLNYGNCPVGYWWACESFKNQGLYFAELLLDQKYQKSSASGSFAEMYRTFKTCAQNEISDPCQPPFFFRETSPGIYYLK